MGICRDMLKAHRLTKNITVAAHQPYLASQMTVKQFIYPMILLTSRQTRYVS